MSTPVAVNVNLDIDVRSEPLGSVMDRLSRISGVRVTLLQGRLTPSHACVRLALTGSSRAVGNAVRASQAWRA